MAESSLNYNEASESQLTGNDFNLLLALACVDLPEGERRNVRMLLKGPVEWDNWVTEAARHGVAGLMYRNLAGMADANVPQHVLARLKKYYIMMTASNMRLLEDFRKVSRAFEENGIDFILLKGAVLVETLYHDLGLRSLSDVDVIVRERDWPQIYGILERFGYTSAGKDFSSIPPKLTRYDVIAHVQYTSPLGSLLEFQFDLYTIGLGMVDIDGVWRRALPAEINGVSVFVPSPEDNLLQMIIHANRHGCSRLKWLVDIAETLRSRQAIDWRLLAKIARREKIGACVSMTMEYIEELFGEQLVDAGNLRPLRPTAAQRRAWNYIWPREELREFRGRSEDGICFYFYRPFSGWNLLNYVLTGRVRDKLSFQARWIMPSHDWMTASFGEASRTRLLRLHFARIIDYLRNRQSADSN